GSALSARGRPVSVVLNQISRRKIAAAGRIDLASTPERLSECFRCLSTASYCQHMALAKSHDPESYPYKLTHSLLTSSEKAFYVALVLASGGRYLVFAKVRLADLCQDLDRWADTGHSIRSRPSTLTSCSAMPRRSGRCSPLSLMIAHISAQTGGIAMRSSTVSSARWVWASIASGCVVPTILLPSRMAARTR